MKCFRYICLGRLNNVAPLAGAWIEIMMRSATAPYDWVAPLAGAWIEISKDFKSAGHYASLPSRERGLKYILFNAREPVFAVAPLAGAWIEIGSRQGRAVAISVAPLAGAWIEILLKSQCVSSVPRRSPRGSVD